MTSYLHLMAEKDASDLFFCTGAVAQIKVQSVMRPVGTKKFIPGEVHKMAEALMNDEQIAEFAREQEMNFALSLKGVGRYRVNVFQQRGETSLVIRFIKSQIPSFADMNLPQFLGDIVMEKNGLVLVTGATGSGKSTTLATMIDHRNRNSSSHILTIEDPLEFIHRHDQSIVQQREVGIDTHSYEKALKNALREGPDVILIGEIRDMETMSHAINYAETGQLCLATLHANNANQTLDRIVNFFPETMHRQIRMDLSLNLRAIISQRLLPSVDGEKYVPAFEVMLNTPYISDLIQQGEIAAIKQVMKDASDSVIITFDQYLLNLYRQGMITEQEALRYADSRNDVSLEIRLGEDSKFDNGPV